MDSVQKRMIVGKVIDNDERRRESEVKGYKAIVSH